MTDGLTKITFLAAALTIGSLACDMKMEIPKWGSRIADSKPVSDKELSSGIYSSSLSADVLTLNMSLGNTSQTTTTGSHVYTSGGLFSSGENAWQDKNPGTSFIFGSRQERCTVGDVLTINGFECQVIGTRVLDPSNVQQTTGAIEPDFNAPGLTPRIASYWDRCDLIICDLTGQDGDSLKALHTSLGSFAGLTVSNVKQSAVAPPVQFYDGSSASSGYEPVITVTDMLDEATPFQKEVLVSGTHYEWDATSGTLWVKRSALPYDSDIRLHYKGYVYDTRQTLYAEDLLNMERALEDMMNNAWISGGGGSGGGVDCSLVLDNEVDAVVDALAILPKAEIEPPPGFADWSFPGDADVLIHDSETKFDGDDLEWQQVSSPSYQIGTEIASLLFIVGEDEARGFGLELLFDCVFPIRFIPILNRIHEDELLEMKIDMSLEVGTLTRETIIKDTTEEPDIFSVEQDVEDDDVEIKIIVAWYSTDGTNITLLKADDSLSVGSTLVKVTEGGIDYLRATVDITACGKSAIASRGLGSQLCLIPWPANAIPPSFDIAGTSVTDFVYSATEVYNASNHSGGNPAVVNIQAWKLRFAGMTLGNMWYRVDKDNLKTADWNATHDGMADSPDLSFVGP